MQDHIRIGEGGRVVIPSAYRKALGVVPGDEIIIRLDEDGEIRLYRQQQALDRFRAMLKEQNITLSVDDFLTFRRQDSGE